MFKVKDGLRLGSNIVLDSEANLQNISSLVINGSTITSNEKAHIHIDAEYPTIQLNDINGDSFYIHTNGNNFYVLSDRDGPGTYGNWDGAYPMQLEADTGIAYLFGSRAFTDAYHPNADKWTTARRHTVTLTGDVTGSAYQDVDGTGNKTWTISTQVSNDSHNHNHSDGDFTANGEFISQISGQGAMGVFKGHSNNNHMITIRGNVTGSVYTPTFDDGHQTCFVEFMSPRDDSTGWFFKDSYNNNAYTYANVAQININGISAHQGGFRIGTTTVIDSGRTFYPSKVDLGSGHSSGVRFHGRSFSWNSSMQSPTSKMPHIWQEDWTGWDPVIGIKTQNGFWQMGAYTNDIIHLGYMTGAYGTHSTNSFDKQIQFKKEGIVNAQSGYEVDGTTVIDSNRNLSSIGHFESASMWVNDGSNYNSYNENIRLFDAPNGVSVIGFSCSGISGEPTTSILGYSNRLETRVGNTWRTRVYAGYLDVNGYVDSDYYRVSGTTVIDSSRNLTNIASITTGRIEMNQTSTSGFFGSASFSWEGNTSYPTLHGESADRWVMICFPHIPYLNSGQRGYTGGTYGSLTRYEAWNDNHYDAGILSRIGDGRFSISRYDLSTPSITAYSANATQHNVNVGGTNSPWNSANRSTLTINGQNNSLLGFTYNGGNSGYVYGYGSTMEMLAYGELKLLSNASGSYYGKLNTGVWNVSHGYQVAGTTVIDSSRNLTSISAGSFSSYVSADNLRASNYLMLQDGYKEIALGWFNFGNSDPNNFIDIIFECSNYWGMVEVEITSSYSYQNACGSLIKRFAVGHNGSYSGYGGGSEELVSDTGLLSNSIRIGSVTRSGSNFIIPINKYTSTNNNFEVRVKLFSIGYSDSTNVYLGSKYSGANLPREYVPFRHITGKASSTSFGGSIEMNGTTVIDSSRNLTNIKGISASQDNVLIPFEFRKNEYSGYNGAIAKFVSTHGHHSWGINTEHRIDDNNGDMPSILFSQGANSNTWSVGFGYNDTGTFRIKRDHGYHNGGWGTALMSMDRSGNVTFAGNVTAYSDERLKTNIKTIENPIGIVSKIRGVSFDWKETGEHAIGVIAQEIEAVPELSCLVSETPEDGTSEFRQKNVAYGNMVGLLIEAIKEQQAQIAELQAEIKEIKGVTCGSSN